ncbi:MAG: PBP1A family penicillin-binding protein [Thermacetogeniaceae bacterium]
MSRRQMDLNLSKQRKRKRRLKPTRVITLVAMLILISLVLVGCGNFAWAIITLPSWDPNKLTGSSSTIVYDRHDQAASQVFADENRTPVPLAELPPYLPQAFVAAEDNRFYEHIGIDPQAIARALWADLRGGAKTEGGSTITQQLVKNAYLSDVKSLRRKIQEAVLALVVERHYSKQEILEMYLNRILFGNGAYGIQAASVLYFDKNAKDLTLAESALLAGIVRSPSNYNPFASPDLAKRRQEIVLDQMVKYGKITQAEAGQAKQQKLQYHEGAKSSYQYPYYTDQVISEAEGILQQQGLTLDAAQNLIYKGGLKIYTALNMPAQQKMEDVFANKANFPADYKGQQVQGAMVLVDQHTGQIQALVGGRQHSVMRPFNRATQAKRQPGSAIKPIVVYSPAIEKGYTEAFVQDDVPATFGPKTFYNYDDQYRGLITMRIAVQNSINTYAVKLLNQIGVDYGYSYAIRMGITTLDPARDRNLSLALGGITNGISPLEMAGAYSAIANQGIYIQPYAIRKILDQNGGLMYEAKPQQKVVMSEQTSYVMTDLLENVVKAGTGTNAQLGRPAAGKTGTTTDKTDAWFMGYTPEYTGAVWIGFDKEATMETMNDVFGATYPAYIWKAVMQKATEDLPVTDFPMPAGLVRATVCSKSGQLPNAFCPQDELENDLFVQGTVPSETCDVHVEATINPADGLLATPYSPNTTTKVFLKRPPVTGKYQPWDMKEALPTQYSPLGAGPTGSTSPNQAANQMVTVKICTDPRHHGVPYLANVPGFLESGGCPPEFVQEEDVPASQAPKLYCSLPDHQVKKSGTLQNLNNLLKHNIQNNQVDDNQTGQ